jgi:hypothetical protein
MMCAVARAPVGVGRRRAQPRAWFAVYESGQKNTTPQRRLSSLHPLAKPPIRR